MKKTWFRLLPLLLCAMMLFSGCAKLPKLEYEDGVYTNQKTGISYLTASVCYEAISFKEDSEVARIERKGVDDLLMYPINGVDSAKMLASADYEVFYAVGTTLPTLAQMNPETVYICKTADMTYSIASITAKADISYLIEVYQGTKGFSKNEIDGSPTKERYDLKFESSSYPGIYYCLTYWQFEEDVLVYELIDDFNDFEITYPNAEVSTEEYKDEKYAVYNFGTALLYDRATGLCYPAGDTVAKYLSGDTQ